MGGRVTLRPVGSPIRPVISPIRKITVWPEVLKVLHLAQQHGVAQVQVGRGGIEAGLDAQFAAGGGGCNQPLAKIFFANDLRHALAQIRKLFVERHAEDFTPNRRRRSGNRGAAPAASASLGRESTEISSPLRSTQITAKNVSSFSSLTTTLRMPASRPSSRRLDEIVRHRARRRNFFDLERDGVRLVDAHPDREAHALLPRLSG
jgi:hypothetical protein